MKNKKVKLTYIEWEDALTWNDGWHDKEGILEWGRSDDWIIKQAGYVIEENKKYILLANKFNPQQFGEHKYSEITKIPKGWIRKRITFSSSLYS